MLETQKLLNKKSIVFRRAVHKWSRDNFRDYPWRRSGRTAYEIVVAEILLKRTTANSAFRQYDEFLQRFPDIKTIYDATEDELVVYLAKVGLQRQRAKTFKALANYLIEHHDGIIPCKLNQLLDIPGLGDYSSRAVLSFGCNIPFAIVDANVERVLVRVFKRSLPVKLNKRTIQELADQLLSIDYHRNYNFGLLDLGALVCRYINPKHKDCPLNKLCDFYLYKKGEETEKTTESKLRRIRKLRRISLANLAKISGVSKLTIIKTESGKSRPTPGTITKLAMALEVHIEDLR